ncbi:site-specific DNA-methyltransferase [Abyssibius alkaniclasticus]|uniref:site-specific DNA-methyltransferase n=1 Tax=Abyssibius alkaniclasticus TaxID=2881234 RepID=UPI00236480B4|nr:site-specific DNA-methyltransferase [Abyssibius alkaniclasticus]UPH70156.1 site-specific DNA-methyltransferase [Abyssibius alkaniclasticus]
MPTLRWLTRDQDVRAAEKVPYRLLEEVPALGYGDRDTGNMLIQGDNLEALKSLLPFYAGQVKCIYIDPPYNTGSAFEHYDDNLEHSQWLAMMWPRLELLRELLAEDGSIWVSIDDREGHYLKVIMDEVFGRENFISNLVWQKKTAPQAHALWFSDNHDHVIVYAKSKNKWKPNPLARTDELNAKYNRKDDPRGLYMPDNFTISLTGGARGAQYARTGVSENIYEITLPSGRKVLPPKGRCWGAKESRYKELLSDNLIVFARGGDGVPMIKRFLKNVKQGTVPLSVMLQNDVGGNSEAKKEVRDFNADEIFSTPKPERLLERILHIASLPGDLIIDSFLGSGTTAAVAQKMGRRYIGIEMGEHAVTHCQPRLAKVVDGEQGGISKAQNWQGGGGFRFFKLGAAVFDETGGLQPDIRFPTLAAHIWFSEMNQPWDAPETSTPFLGALGGKGIALLYNGILGDKSVNGGNVLNRQTLRLIREAAGDFDGPLTIYGERTVLADTTLEGENITFKQTPYDVRARK